MFRYFTCQLYNDDNCSKEEENNVTLDNSTQNINKIDPFINDYFRREIQPHLSDIDIIESQIDNNRRNNYKKRKIPKMKIYNYKKGDWQCQYCFNINFHFRKKCNVCNRCKQ